MRDALLHAAYRGNPRGGLSRHRPRRRPTHARGPFRDEPRTSDIVLAVIGVALIAGLGLIAAAAGLASAPLHP